MASLSTQLLTVAIISLQRQLYHNRGLIFGDTKTCTSLPSYDFVIVGGGSAGSVVAGRLSENPSVQVLLLEAGGPVTVTSDMLSTYYFYDYNWGYFTVPQKNAGLFVAFGAFEQYFLFIKKIFFFNLLTKQKISKMFLNYNISISVCSP